MIFYFFIFGQINTVQAELKQHILFCYKYSSIENPDILYYMFLLAKSTKNNNTVLPVH